MRVVGEKKEHFDLLKNNYVISKDNKSPLKKSGE